MVGLRSTPGSVTLVTTASVRSVRRDGEPWCGVCIVDLRSGDLVEWIRLDGAIKELFDVAVIEGVTCPMALGVNSPDIQSLVSFEPEFGPLVPAD